LLRASQWLFFAPLGCLELHVINSSIATGLCIFFQKIAKENPSKKEPLRFGNLPKKDAPNKS
jgi:hypothetical protein